MATATTNKPLTGRRKEAVARVRLTAGTGNVKINDRTPLEYLKRDSLVLIALGALAATNLADKFDVSCRVMGGGTTGQAGAIRLGIARALVEYDETLKGELRKAGFMTRDAREVERKKVGLHKARRATQFSKR